MGRNSERQVTPYLAKMHRKEERPKTNQRMTFFYKTPSECVKLTQNLKEYPDDNNN